MNNRRTSNLIRSTVALGTALGFTAIVIGFAAVVRACPMCADALSDPSQAAAFGRLSRGFGISIAALIGMPFLLVGVIAWRIVRGIRAESSKTASGR